MVGRLTCTQSTNIKSQSQLNSNGTLTLTESLKTNKTVIICRINHLKTFFPDFPPPSQTHTQIVSHVAKTYFNQTTPSVLRPRVSISQVTKAIVQPRTCPQVYIGSVGARAGLAQSWFGLGGGGRREKKGRLIGSGAKNISPPPMKSRSSVTADSKTGLNKQNASAHLFSHFISNCVRSGSCHPKFTTSLETKKINVFIMYKRGGGGVRVMLVHQEADERWLKRNQHSVINVFPNELVWCDKTTYVKILCLNSQDCIILF